MCLRVRVFACLLFCWCACVVDLLFVKLFVCLRG